MKVNISLPIELFKTVEESRMLLGMSRGQICTQALTDYVGDLDLLNTTRVLNTMYAPSEGGAVLDPALEQLQHRSVCQKMEF